MSSNRSKTAASSKKSSSIEYDLFGEPISNSSSANNSRVNSDDESSDNFVVAQNTTEDLRRAGDYMRSKYDELTNSRASRSIVLIETTAEQRKRNIGPAKSIIKRTTTNKSPSSRPSASGGVRKTSSAPSSASSSSSGSVNKNSFLSKLKSMSKRR
eukprot:TRINITY_DN10063_c0_g1_i1.p2 TRINITY_DN10063_c0_g1~~TRINITY_DN10063_c0_g1_i1.p2  ORF type:complete len:156 (-),score=58.10 TRINITY_DN10063_c0_g1_i1:63-530(-)